MSLKGVNNQKNILVSVIGRIKMSNQKYSLTEGLIIIFGLLMITLIGIIEAVIRIFKTGYNIWFDWIDNE